LANKQDLPEAKKSDDISEVLKLKQYQTKREFAIAEVSADTGTGIKEAMEDLAKRMKVHLKNAAKEEKNT